MDTNMKGVGKINGMFYAETQYFT